MNQTILQCFMTSSMPFGGVGSSGLGRYYGKYGFDSLSHANSILVSPADVKVDALLPPYTEQKAASSGELFAVSNSDAQHQENYV